MNSGRDELSVRIVSRVAAASDRDATELPHLYDSVEPDALNDLIAHIDDGSVRFTYAGATVFVDSDGNIDVLDATRSEEEPSPGTSRATD